MQDLLHLQQNRNICKTVHNLFLDLFSPLVYSNSLLLWTILFSCIFIIIYCFTNITDGRVCYIWSSVLKYFGNICLPSSGNCLVTGWGKLSEGGISAEILQKVVVPIISDQQCAAKYRAIGYSGPIAETMMCAGYGTGKLDACQVGTSTVCLNKEPWSFSFTFPVLLHFFSFTDWNMWLSFVYRSIWLLQLISEACLEWGCSNQIPILEVIKQYTIHTVLSKWGPKLLGWFHFYTVWVMSLFAMNFII